MKITGYWVGSYQQNWPSEGEILPLLLRLERSWWGAVRGTVYFGEEEEQAGGQPVRGWQHFRGLSFSVDVGALNKQRAQAQTGAAAPASGTPSHFWADRVVTVDELAGQWKFLVWMMVGPSGKKAQVGIAEGTWTVQRTGLSRTSFGLGEG